MTAARHRSASAAASRSPEGPGLHGKAPGGMWWVAWRQHRLQIAVTLALIAIVIAALIAFREVVIARFAAAGCDPAGMSCSDASGGDIWYNDGLNSWHSLLEAVVLLAPIVLGAFVGAPIFTREFSRGTHVFALTQSVGRLRWWAVKITVAGVPLIAGLVVLGFVTGWVDGTTGYTAHNGLDTGQFATRAVIPAAHGLFAVAIAVAAGIVTRSTVAALVSGLIVAGAALVGMIVVQPHVLPPTRQATTLETLIQDNFTPSLQDRDPDLRYISGGYLDGQGRTMPAQALRPCYGIADNAAREAVGLARIPDTGGSAAGVAVSPQDEQAMDSPKYQTAFNNALLACAHGKGIVASYTDYLPGSLLWPLRGVMSGIAVAVAALFLILGAVRLRAAVAKR